MEEDFLCMGAGAYEIGQFNSIEEFLTFLEIMKISLQEESKIITIQGNGSDKIKIGE